MFKKLFLHDLFTGDHEVLQQSIIQKMKNLKRELIILLLISIVSLIIFFAMELYL